MKSKFMDDLKRFSLFSSGVLGTETKIAPEIGPEIFKNYARFILTQGSHDERKDILGTFQKRLTLKDKIVQLAAE